MPSTWPGPPRSVRTSASISPTTTTGPRTPQPSPFSPSVPEHDEPARSPAGQADPETPAPGAAPVPSPEPGSRRRRSGHRGRRQYTSGHPLPAAFGYGWAHGAPRTALRGDLPFTAHRAAYTGARRDAALPWHAGDRARAAARPGPGLARAASRWQRGAGAGPRGDRGRLRDPGASTGSRPRRYPAGTRWRQLRPGAGPTAPRRGPRGDRQRRGVRAVAAAPRRSRRARERRHYRWWGPLVDLGSPVSSLTRPGSMSARHHRRRGPPSQWTATGRSRS